MGTISNINQHTLIPFVYLDNDSDDDDDSASLESLDTDDGEDHLPEKIIAEFKYDKPDRHWYLLKWHGCSLLRSSWEGVSTIQNIVEEQFAPNLLTDWEEELQKQARGETKPLDIEAFNIAVENLEKAERQRRVLQRLKHKVNRVLSILTA